ncbi:MAG: hypothetical protein ACTSX9_05270 [Candidatus Njordarchaeales archaeon]
MTRTTQVDYYSGIPDNIEGYGYIDIKAAIDYSGSLKDDLVKTVTQVNAYSYPVYWWWLIGYYLVIEVQVTDVAGCGVPYAWILIWITDYT